MKDNSEKLLLKNDDELYDQINNNLISEVQMANQGKFKATREQLSDIMTKYENRKLCEEIDYIQRLGGLSYLEKSIPTDFQNGIEDNEDLLKMRIEKYGSNQGKALEEHSFWEMLLEALDDFILKILIVSAFVSIILSTATAEPKDRSHAWMEGFAILVAVAVCSLVAATNDYQKEKQFRELNKIADKDKEYAVRRQGRDLSLHHSQLLVGDIVTIREGIDIPADGILIDSQDITTDESAMTGESDLVKKNTFEGCQQKLYEFNNDKSRGQHNSHTIPSCCLMSGTKVQEGSGKMLVIVVGEQSCIGRIKEKIKQDDEATPLQQKLEAIANDIGKFGFISACIIVGALLIRFSIERISSGEFESRHATEILSYFIIGVTVVVVAIPEGLPLSVTLSLAFSVKRMLTDQNLVRKMQACETMGGADMICSDKTGTLTQNKMTLTKIYNNHDYDVHPNYQCNSRPIDQNLNSIISDPSMLELFTQITIFNTTADINDKKKSNKTELAILEFLNNDKNKIDIQQFKSKPQYKVMRQFPFSSKRKRMGTVLQINGNQYRLLEKGASEILLDCCSHVQYFTGERKVLDQNEKHKIQTHIDQYAQGTLRTLIFAYKDLVKDINDNEEQDQFNLYDVEKSGLTLVALVGIKDVLRLEVKQAIKDCKTAGIIVRMVTGDNKLTAQAIAKECGILEFEHQYAVMEGAEFMNKIGGIVCKNCRLDKECRCDLECRECKSKQECKCPKREKRVDTIANSNEFDNIYKYLRVLARSRPEDKYALVTGLMEKGHVVAVTGDGTNDAPALKKASVGFAMGIAGTDVSKEAADIILLDDNFKSVVQAVKWGRNIYDNIKKFLQFQLTVNLVAVLSTLVGAVVLKQQIMTPIQMLWINLIMDSLASLALATESPTDELLLRKPHGKNEYMVTANMTKHIVGQSIYQMVVIMVICFLGESFIPEVKDSLDDHINQQLLTNPDYQKLGGMQMKYSNEQLTHVRSGRMKTVSDNTNLFPLFSNQYKGLDYFPIFQQIGPSRHFTLLFNSFVWMTVFNFLNARLLNDKINVFKGIFNNYLFLLIIGFIAFLQTFLITFGGLPFSCYYWAPFYGLHHSQWVWCILFGFLGMIWSVVLKLMPLEKIQIKVNISFGNRQEDPLQRQHSKSILNYRRSASNVKFSSDIIKQ